MKKNSEEISEINDLILGREKKRRECLIDVEKVVLTIEK